MTQAAELRRKGLWAKKRFGQHFLLDPSILARIAAAAGDLSQAAVIEVGPGPGGLTRALLTAGPAQLVAIERDRRFADHLRELEAAAHGRLTIIEGDALTVDPFELVGSLPVRIVANLPYNVATPLLFGWFERLDRVELMVLMFQKEVAERLLAKPGTGDYGRLAVTAQLLCRIERRFDLPPAAFTPPPRVSSSVVRLTPHPEQPPAALRQAMARLTHAAFGQRRKMLRQSLRPLGGDPAVLLDLAGVDPTARAENVDLPAFRRLAEALLGAEARV